MSATGPKRAAIIDTFKILSHICVRPTAACLDRRFLTADQVRKFFPSEGQLTQLQWDRDRSLVERRDRHLVD